jgi:excinuclease ABC subunit C
VSQIQGTDVVASMVVFEDGLPRKSEYRRFAVRGNPDGSGTDDLSAMSEVMRRRFARYKAQAGADAPRDRPESDSDTDLATADLATADLATADLAMAGLGAADSGAADLATAGLGAAEVPPAGLGAAELTAAELAGAELAAGGSVSGAAGSGELMTSDLPGIDPLTGRPRRFAYPPQLIVVDGGQPQVNAVATVMADMGITDVALCGLAKRLEEVWLPGEDFPVILPRTSESLYLLQRIRDEAHRFAITFHRQRRSKRMTASALDGVPGLGEARRKALLRHFGSLKRLAAATPEEITEVPGIGRVTAEAVLVALNPPTAGSSAPETPGEPEAGAIPPGGAGKTRPGAARPRGHGALPAPAPVRMPGEM